MPTTRRPSRSADLEDLLAKGSNGLIIGAATTDVANSILERAEQDGIPVIIVDRLVTSDKYTTFVTSDNHVMATTCLSHLCTICSAAKGRSRSSKGSPVRVRRSSGTPPMTRCWQFPEIEVAARQAGDWSRASGQRVDREHHHR